jgi:hypothetical protein
MNSSRCANSRAIAATNPAGSRRLIGMPPHEMNSGRNGHRNNVSLPMKWMRSPITHLAHSPMIVSQFDVCG